MNRRKTLWVIIIVLGTCTPPTALSQDWLYEARPGDTLWDLCLEYTARSGCWIELGKYNNIANDRGIPPGREIRIPIAWLLELPIVGEVLTVRGEVTYQEQHGSGAVPLQSGQTLVLGSLINCVNGSATLRLSDNSELLLRPGSILELSNMTGGSGPGQASELTLDRGELEIAVPPASRSRFEVHTPSAIAAVRGTQYRVVSIRQQEDTTRGEVLEGQVAVEATATVEVQAGFGVKAKQGEPPGEPRKLLDAPVFSEPRVDSPLPVAVAWSDDPGAVAWQLDVYSEGSAAALLVTHRTSDPDFAFTDLAEGCYRLVVRGIDGEDFNGLNGEVPMCVEPPEPHDYWDLVLWCALAALMLI